MSELTTTYMGLTLKNPIIASSSGLTNTLENIKAIAKHGAGAVVLKSLFEEVIIMEAEDNINKMQSSGFIYPETIEYFDYDDMEDPVANYLKLISDSKAAVTIPIIASVNCVTADKWPEFAKRIQDAGADAIELNIFALPSDFNRTAEQNEQLYFDIISKVTSMVNIPVGVKISPYNASLGRFIKKLSETSIKSIVLFNRFYNPDFDINTFEYTSGVVFSSPAEFSLPLRWTAIMAERITCDIATSTGVHDGHAVIKSLLAGASAAQVASTLYMNGFEYIETILKQIEIWMKGNGYKSIAEFKGKMSQAKSYDPAAFERVQFMKHFKDLKR